ncbi:hypothetical protein PCANC_06132 [Puccinia coronata f. sp. avenae]|uniref:Protein CPL1-like domain-containing protein n=1 Tax=Puccinia coronata f. sp. avenae TaxID=200324 RepID=A0A2N5VTQ8_9BASI|nr:hypothetical protein PCASD_07376 [Puccinia coronata f. sp. avenae]PLW53380.1 hypothetical protein PCANC_06132 [Puccinia coronata f. sp. avenae]
MLAIQTLSLVAFLSSVLAYDLPMVTPPSITGTHVPSQQIAGRGLTTSSGLTSAWQVNTGLSSASCGLSTNVWGQVSSTCSSGYANLCLQCRVNILGVEVVNFSYASALATSISAHGVSADHVAILQNYIDNDLSKLSAGCKTSVRCKTVCSGDQRCKSSSYSNGNCQFQSVDYRTQNKAGQPLSQAFQSIFATKGSGFCSICPSDTSCSSTPQASGLARRSVKSQNSGKEQCPTGLSACPISSGLGASSSFECIDVQQEVTSCGGCSTTGKGVDCTTLKGVASSGCSDGQCKIFSCKTGYQYSATHNVCIKSSRSPKINQSI